MVRANQYLVYPYQNNKILLEQELRELFPQTLEYLSNYRALLSVRQTVAVGGKSWYELQRPRDENWLNRKKLLIRDLAVKTSFAVDDTGGTFLGGGTAVIPTDEDSIFPLMGYLNSKLANWFLLQITPSFRADFQKFETQHFATLPVLKNVMESPELKYILTELVGSVLGAKEIGDDVSQQRYETEIDKLLCEVAEIDFDEIS